jgi:hypothetical protein
VTLCRDGDSHRAAGAKTKDWQKLPVKWESDGGAKGNFPVVKTELHCNSQRVFPTGAKMCDFQEVGACGQPNSLSNWIIVS